MRLHDLTEQWFNTYSVNDERIDVFNNPTKTEFNKLISRIEGEVNTAIEWPLRAFITNDDLYVWSAYQATHSDMSAFGIPSLGGYLYLNRTQILFNDLNWEYADEGDKLYRRGVRRYYEATINNPTIRRIYGSNPTIIGADDETKHGGSGLFPITPSFIEDFVEK